VKQKAGGGAIAIAVVVLVAIGGALYWFTFGKGSSRAQVDEKWGKPIDMRAVKPGKFLPDVPPQPGSGPAPPVGGVTMPPTGGPPPR